MTEKKSKRLTIKDVAAKAGVSLATTSRALSGRGYVSEETKSLVFQAAAELGYKPHAAARSLKLQRTNNVGLIIADIVNPFYAFLADGVLTCSQQLDYRVILCATEEDTAMERDYLMVLMEQRVDGIIAVPGGHNLAQWQEVIDLGIKLVLVDREIAGLTGHDTVTVDNVQGAYSAIEHLIGLGHQRIGIINGPVSATTGHDRLQGYYNALEQAGILAQEELIQIGSFKRDSGFQATHRLLSLSNPPTAIFATNNVLGEAAMFAIRERKLSIPDDVSLVMFDDVPWASLTTPRLTVVAQPTHSLGFIAMEILDQRLAHADEDDSEPVKTVLQPELIVRDSSIAVSTT